MAEGQVGILEGRLFAGIGVGYAAEFQQRSVRQNPTLSKMITQTTAATVAAAPAR